MLDTLHQAMIEVLQGRGWMQLQAVADEIANRDLWRRPSDGAYPAADQISKRARQSGGQYVYLFEVQGKNIRLK